MPLQKTRLRPHLLLALLASASALAFSLSGRMLWDADQAIVAMSAHDILRGERPVFLPGQEFLGAAENYWLALVFSVLPETVWAYRVAGGVLFVVTVLVFHSFARRAFGPRAGLFAGLWMVLGPPFFLYRTMVLGGYTALVLVGALVLAFLVRIEDRARTGRPLVFEVLALGFLLGFGFWLSYLTFTYAAACLVAWLAGTARKRLGLAAYAGAAAAFLIGSLPFWLRNLQTGWATFRAPEIPRATAAYAAGQLRLLFTDGLPTLFGAIPMRRQLPSFPGARAVPTVLLLLLAAYGLRLFLRKRGSLEGYASIVLLTLFVVPPVLVLQTARTDLTEPRYLMAFYLPAAALLGALLADSEAPRAMRAAGLVLAVALTVGGHLNEPLRTDFSVEKGPSWSLVRELRARGIDSLYANYWTAYRVTFASERAVVATPFGLWRLTRFPADRAWVDGSAAPAILLGPDEAAFLERFLEGTRYRREELEGGVLFTGMDPSRLAVLRGLHCVPGQEGCR